MYKTLTQVCTQLHTTTLLQIKQQTYKKWLWLWLSSRHVIVRANQTTTRLPPDYHQTTTRLPPDYQTT